MAIFNMSKFRLSDVEFFCDRRLDNINVYSVVLVTNSFDFDMIISDFCQRMKDLSCVQMIQQSADDFTRFTFVSHVDCFTFSKCIHTIVNILSSIYKCQINIL